MLQKCYNPNIFLTDLTSLTEKKVHLPVSAKYLSVL